MRMAHYELPASNDRFDMWRLTKVGGEITFYPNGKMVFRFKTKSQYDRFLKLNNQRGVQA